MEVLSWFFEATEGVDPRNSDLDQDFLHRRYKVVAEDDYRRTAATLTSEQAMIQTDIRTLEATQVSIFELIEGNGFLDGAAL